MVQKTTNLTFFYIISSEKEITDINELLSHLFSDNTAGSSEEDLRTSSTHKRPHALLDQIFKEHPEAVRLTGEAHYTTS